MDACDRLGRNVECFPVLTEGKDVNMANGDNISDYLLVEREHLSFQLGHSASKC